MTRPTRRVRKRWQRHRVRPIANVELAIVDADGNELPAGSPGEILLRGPNVMRGYYNDPEATAEAVDADGWLQHRAMSGVLDAAGNLKVTDRIKDMLIVGGFNVYPAEVESVLSSSPGGGARRSRGCGQTNVSVKSAAPSWFGVRAIRPLHKR